MSTKPQRCTICRKPLNLQRFPTIPSIGKCNVCGTFYTMPNGRKSNQVPRARVDDNFIRRYRYYWQKSEKNPIIFRGFVNKFLHKQIVD